MKRLLLFSFLMLTFKLTGLCQNKKVAVMKTKTNEDVSSFQSNMVRGGMEAAVANAPGYVGYDHAFDVIIEEQSSILAESERSAIAVDGNVHKVLKSHWQQVSMSIQHASEPFGEVESTFDEDTGLYHVIAKVGIRGDRYVKLLDGVASVKPNNLSDDDLQQFIDANQTIIDASKGN